MFYKKMKKEIQHLSTDHSNTYYPSILDWVACLIPIAQSWGFNPVFGPLQNESEEMHFFMQFDTYADDECHPLVAEDSSFNVLCSAYWKPQRKAYDIICYVIDA